MKLSEQDLHNIGHARYLVERATDDKPEVCFDFTLVRSILNVIDRQTNEIHELNRTRSEAEANANVAGYRQGEREARRRFYNALGASQVTQMREALEPFAKNIEAVSLVDALGHIGREDLVRARDALAGL